MKKFETVVKQYSPKRQTVKVIEKGDVEWDPKDAKIREEIIKTVGMEYKQINYLAAVVYEILKQNKDLQSSPIVQDALAKFEKINEIRNSK
jgi:transcription elongation factor GreA-like protein